MLWRFCYFYSNLSQCSFTHYYHQSALFLFFLWFEFYWLLLPAIEVFLNAFVRMKRLCNIKCFLLLYITRLLANSLCSCFSSAFLEDCRRERMLGGRCLERGLSPSLRQWNHINSRTKLTWEDRGFLWTCCYCTGESQIRMNKADAHNHEC